MGMHFTVFLLIPQLLLCFYLYLSIYAFVFRLKMGLEKGKTLLCQLCRQWGRNRSVPSRTLAPRTKTLGFSSIISLRDELTSMVFLSLKKTWMVLDSTVSLYRVLKYIFFQFWSVTDIDFILALLWLLQTREIFVHFRLCLD